MTAPPATGIEQQLRAVRRDVRRAQAGEALDSDVCDRIHAVWLQLPEGDPRRRELGAALVQAVMGVIVNVVTHQLRVRSGQDRGLPERDELVAEGVAFLLKHVLGRYTAGSGSWPAYAKTSLRGHIHEVLIEAEYGGLLKASDITVLKAVSRLLEDRRGAGRPPTDVELRRAAAEFVEQAVEERMLELGEDRDEALRALQKNSLLATVNDIEERWSIYRNTGPLSLDERVSEDGATREELVGDPGAHATDRQALDGLVAPPYEQRLGQLLVDGIEPEYRAVLDDLADQRCAGDGAPARARTTEAVRRVFADELAALRSSERERAVTNRAKVARARRRAVQDRTADPLAQWSYLAAEVAGQLTGDWPELDAA